MFFKFSRDELEFINRGRYDSAGIEWGLVYFTVFLSLETADEEHPDYRGCVGLRFRWRH